jgi:hypothetical protein
METKTKTPAFILKLAAKIFASYRKDWELYDADCAEYAKEGYRPRTCFHGTNLWTDFDPMCGPCEDGYGWFDPMMYRQMSLQEAKATYNLFNERLDLYVKLSAGRVPGIEYGQLIQWVAEPLKKWDAVPEGTAVSTDPPF